MVEKIIIIKEEDKMKKVTKLLILFSIILVLSINIALAGNCPGVITMKNQKMFNNHKMPIVKFEHTKHVEDYNCNCGSCHHDKKGNKLKNITCNDNIKSCAGCHSKPNGNIKSSIKYFSGAIHQNCTNCHKKNSGPTSCTNCHKREK